jgi:uncharacterized protein YceH (UPF0502 family)
MSETSPDPAAWPTLSPVEARVLGALIEKQIATPEYYPLTPGALVAACNQKSNRDPVMQLDEPALMAALDTLREKKAVWQVFLAGNRVAKFRHAFLDVYHVSDAAVPLLTELLLRGPQTAAELRSRAARLQAAFVDVAAVETELQTLIDHAEGPFVVRLAREPGRRETRYAHLLGGPVALAAATPESADGAAPAGAGVLQVSLSPERARIAQLEGDVAALGARVAQLEEKLAAFVRQFG